MSPWTRRRLLTALGLTGAGAALPGRRARAEDAPPKRLIVFSTGHGAVYDGWSMRPPGVTDAGGIGDLTTLSETDFSPILRPLHSHRRRLCVADGVSQLTAELDLAGYRHEKGWIHAWTGAWAHLTGNGVGASAPSLDQLVAAHIARPDRLPALELSVQTGRPISHAGRAQPVPLEGDPHRAWERVFGLAQSADPAVSAQGSVLDYVLEEAHVLRTSLGAGDQRRLDQHFDLVRQLERRLVGLAQAECDAPGQDRLVSTSARYDEVFRSMAEVAVAALSCDLTRVVTLSMGDIPSDDFGWGWYLSGDAHNDFAHRVFADPEAAQAMTDYGLFHAVQLAWLASLLESMPDGHGGSLLDHTLIVWGNELADGWHGYEKALWLTVGGDWVLPGGTYAHHGWDATPVPLLGPDGLSRGAGVPHQQVLVSVAQAMGLPTDTVGLDSVQSRGGARISLSGRLPGWRG